MKFPLRDEINDLFAHDRSIWWKVLGGAAATTLAVAICGARTLRRQQGQLEVPPGLIAVVLVASALVGAALGILLSLKDVVERRQAAGQPVNLVLRIYFGYGLESLLVWGVTIVVVAFPAIIVVFGFMGI